MIGACVWCGASLAGKRIDARTCSKPCRQALSRFGGPAAAEARPETSTLAVPKATRLANAGARPVGDGRECAWCFGSLDGKRPHARTCSKPCRQALARWESGARTEQHPIRARTARARTPQLRTVAALYVARGGPYFDLPAVEPWTVGRDARRYAGPHPVVAHPPCTRWCRLAGLVEARWGYARGDDDGCFAAALEAVRRWGGVLEHPAYTEAWPAFGLVAPSRFGGWSASGSGWVCHVEQGRYGHAAKKGTWLYAHGIASELLPDLRWGYEPDAEGAALVSWCGNGTDTRPRLGRKAASRTPNTFRAALLSLARLAAARDSMDATAAAGCDAKRPRALADGAPAGVEEVSRSGTKNLNHAGRA